MKPVVRFLLRHRRAMLGVHAAVLAIAAYSARRVLVRFQYRDFYAYPGNPQLPKYEEFHRVFSDPAGYVAVMIRARDVFQPQVLGYVRDLTRALEPNDEFARVRSLFNVNVVRGVGDDVVSGPAVGIIPATAEQAAALRQQVVRDPLLVRRLVSADGTTTAVLAEMRVPAEFSSIAQQKKAIQVVGAAVARLPAPAGVTVDVTGAPVVEVETTSSLLSDQLVLMPGVIGVITIALLVTFRSWVGTLLPLASVVMGLGWTAGIFACFGRPIDIVGSIIPTTLLVYGVVDPIFVLTRFLKRRGEGMSREDAIVAAVSELALPCFLTSAVTALGFAVFMTAKIPTIFYYGLTVAIGVLLTWVSTVVALPVLLMWLPEPRNRSAALRSTEWVASRIEALWHRVRPHRRAVLVGAAILLVGGGYLARVQHISNEYVGSLPHGRAADTVRLMEQKLSGVVRTAVYLEGPPGSMKRPDVLRAIASIDAFLEQEPVVTTSISLADLVEEANQSFNGGDPRFRRVPDSPALIAQYLTMIDPADRSDSVTADYARSAITALSVDTGSEYMRGLRSRLQAKVDQALAGLGIHATLTGNAVVAWSAMDDIIHDILFGFVLAFVAAAVLVWIPFRSARTAVGIVVPNLLPVVCCFLLFRAARLNLRLDNAIVLCVAIGGLFNTTIHFISQLRAGAASRTGDPDAIISRAVYEVAPPSFFTASILSAGFAVLLLSSFPGLKALGGLSMVTLGAAFWSDMLVTPVIMRQLFGWRRAAQPAHEEAPEPPLEVAAAPAISTMEVRRP